MFELLRAKKLKIVNFFFISYFELRISVIYFVSFQFKSLVFLPEIFLRYFFSNPSEIYVHSIHVNAVYYKNIKVY